MALSSKNWNDRADKDLFFTILSVKNIGVISGSEWITIGNHMRSLGYGFTNEGCRQHFQGLRRAQNKADANGNGTETAKRVDPTLNPITRRPGPGRGRPRKQQLQHQPEGQQQDQQQGQQVAVSPPPDLTGGPIPVPSPGTASSLAQEPGPYPSVVTGHFLGAAPGSAPGSLTAALAQHASQEALLAPLERAAAHTAEASSAPDTSLSHAQPPAPAGLNARLDPAVRGAEPDEVDVDADGAESAGPMEPNEHVVQGAGNEEEQQQRQQHPAKRLKIEPHDSDAEAETETGHGASLEDDAVLALAAHNGSTAGEQYGSDFDNYGET